MIVVHVQPIPHTGKADTDIPPPVVSAPSCLRLVLVWWPIESEEGCFRLDSSHDTESTIEQRFVFFMAL
jgi:hypothetical protein